MSVQDETWDRPVCNNCNQLIAYGEMHLHGPKKCGMRSVAIKNKEVKKELRKIKLPQ